MGSKFSLLYDSFLFLSNLIFIILNNTEILKKKINVLKSKFIRYKSVSWKKYIGKKVFRYIPTQIKAQIIKNKIGLKTNKISILGTIFLWMGLNLKNFFTIYLETINFDKYSLETPVIYFPLKHEVSKFSISGLPSLTADIKSSKSW